MAMASRAIRREDVTKGDPIYVLVRYGRDGEQVKRKKARVVDVLRAAAIVDRIEGETGARTVRFNDLELIPKVGPQPPSVVQARRLSADADVPEDSMLREVPRAFAELSDEIVANEVAETVERARPQLVSVEKAAPVDVPVELSDPVVEVVQKPEAGSSERPTSVDAWIAQGTALREQMVEKGSAVENEIAKLEEQRAQLDAMLAARKQELAKIQGLIDLMAQLDGVSR